MCCIRAILEKKGKKAVVVAVVVAVAAAVASAVVVVTAGVVVVTAGVVVVTAGSTKCCSYFCLCAGCSAHNQNSVVNGAFPERNMSACLAESGPPSSSDPALKSGEYVLCSHPPYCSLALMIVRVLLSSKCLAK